MKRTVIFLMTLLMFLLLSACGATKILHCDHCGAEVAVKESSNMEEDWIIYCGPCNEALFGEDFIS